MWVLWIVSHHPAISLPTPVTLPLLLVAQLASIFMWSTKTDRASRPVIGLSAGVVAGLVNALLLFPMVVSTESAAGPAHGLEGLRPGVLAMAGGFLLVSAVIGLAAGFFARSRPEPLIDPSRSAWLMRLAVVAAVATVPLLLLGGLVTSTRAGLSVPDWPGTYGANMFLYPVALMGDPRIFLEHTHRLFGSLVGLTTLVLLAMTIAIEKRGWLKVFAVVLFIAVCLQGYMGGLRVTNTSQWLAVSHGVFAQLFFGAMVMFAACVSPAWTRTPGDASNPVFSRGLKLSMVLLVCLALQLSFGAMWRHLHAKHALFSHIGFSVVVLILAIITGLTLKRAKQLDTPHGQIIGRVGGGISHTVGLQFALGWVAFFVIDWDGKKGAAAIPTADKLADTAHVEALPAIVRTLHQANGALLLALVCLGAIWAVRAARRAA
jgi:cytochrome c oxidase assembly protein subunit 15